jgi:hypothetical protein
MRNAADYLGAARDDAPLRESVAAPNGSFCVDFR